MRTIRQDRRRPRHRKSFSTVPPFVIALLVTLVLQRSLQAYALITFDSCEVIVFWLHGWDDGRSVLQMTAYVIGAFSLWFLVWLPLGKQFAAKLGCGIVLAGWALAFDTQVATILPDRSFNLAERFFPRDEPRIHLDDLYYGRWERTIVERFVDADLRAALEGDPLVEWRPSYVGSAFQPDGVTAVHYYGVARVSWLIGKRAPYAYQIDGVTHCARYNAAVRQRHEDDLASGATSWPKDSAAYYQAALRGQTNDIVDLPPAVYDPVPYGVEY